MRIAQRPHVDEMVLHNREKDQLRMKAISLAGPEKIKAIRNASIKRIQKEDQSLLTLSFIFDNIHHQVSGSFSRHPHQPISDSFKISTSTTN